MTFPFVDIINQYKIQLLCYNNNKINELYEASDEFTITPYILLKFRYLQKLDIYSNHVITNISCKYLTNINVGNSNVNININNLTKLKHLSIYHNINTTKIENFKYLTCLDITQTNVYEINNCPNLKKILADRSKLTNFDNYQYLTHLDVSNINKINITNCPNLKRIDAYNSKQIKFENTLIIM